MEENLLGYLLDALDPETHRETEKYLETHPEAQEKLRLLRQSLEPLSWDHDGFAPPEGLIVKTVGRVAEFCCREVPPAPEPPKSPPATLRFPPLRRIDVLVAATLLLAILGVGFPWIIHVREEHKKMVCQQNLEEIYVGLTGYSKNHQNEFPNLEKIAKPPRNVAGLVVPFLIAKEHLGDDFVIRCPGTQTGPLPVTYQEAMNMPEEEFLQQADNLTPGYGYTLGYRDADGIYHGYSCSNQNPNLILMADAPPPNPIEGNSLNHGRRGQNLLFVNGNVKFQTVPKSFFQDDDLYLNKAKKQKAGQGLHDIVIGHSRARP